MRPLLVRIAKWDRCVSVEGDPADVLEVLVLVWGRVGLVTAAKSSSNAVLNWGVGPWEEGR